MSQSAIVNDHRVLASMERAGFIIRNGKPNQTERHWTGRHVPLITVEAGPALEFWHTPFTYKGKEYRIKYFDGCFYSFVVRLDVPHPTFV